MRNKRKFGTIYSAYKAVRTKKSEGGIFVSNNIVPEHEQVVLFEIEEEIKICTKILDDIHLSEELKYRTRKTLVRLLEHKIATLTRIDNLYFKNKELRKVI